MWWMWLWLACAEAPADPVVHEVSKPEVEEVEPAPTSLCPATVAGLPASDLFDPADSRLQSDGLIVALKESRRLMRYRGGTLVADTCWPMGLASGVPSGTKQQQGDLKTPEGWYRTSDKPWSQFYGAIAVHYPNARDAARGEAAGLISANQRAKIAAALEAGEKPLQTTRLGGEILIHGGGGSTDWTLGCLALDDAHIDDLRASLGKPYATDVLILP